MSVLKNAGLMALASMFVCILPLVMGIVYALWPNEPRLTLVRTLSLAGVCSSICGAMLGFINVLMAIVRRAPEGFSPIVATGLAETLVTLFFGFGCLTVTWLCVTIGLWRRAAAAS